MTKQQFIARRELAAGGRQRQVQPSANQLGAGPGEQKWQGNRQGPGTHKSNGDAQSYGKPWRQIKADLHWGSFLAAQLSLRGGFPFKEPPVREAQADEGPNNGIQRDQRLVKQEDKRKEDVDLFGHEASRCFLQGSFPVFGTSGGDHGKHKLQIRRRQQQYEGGDCPIERSTRQEKPAGDQKSQSGSLNQAAAQVIQDLPS